MKLYTAIVLVFLLLLPSTCTFPSSLNPTSALNYTYLTSISSPSSNTWFAIDPSYSLILICSSPKIDPLIYSTYTWQQQPTTSLYSFPDSFKIQLFTDALTNQTKLLSNTRNN